MPASKKINKVGNKSLSFVILAVFVLVLAVMLFYLISSRPSPVATLPGVPGETATSVPVQPNSTQTEATAPTTVANIPPETTQAAPSTTASVVSTSIATAAVTTAVTAPTQPTPQATALPLGNQNRPSPTIVVAPTPTPEKTRVALPPAVAVANGFSLKLNQPEVGLAVDENGQNILYRFKLETIAAGSEEERAIRRFVPGFPTLYGLAIFYSSADSSGATSGQFYYLGEIKTGSAARLSRNFAPGGNYTATDIFGSCRGEPGCQLYLGKTAEPGKALLTFSLGEKLSAPLGYLLRITRT